MGPDIFTINDLVWPPTDEISRTIRGTVLLRNAYALYFEQQDSRPGELSVQDSTFLIKTLKPYGTVHPTGNVHRPETLVRTRIPELGIPELELRDTLKEQSTNDLIFMINAIAQLPELKRGKQPYLPFVLGGNVLGKNPGVDPVIDLTQLWKQPIDPDSGTLMPLPSRTSRLNYDSLA